jgi:hypothetical protein
MRLDCAHRRSDLTLLQIFVALSLLLPGHKALVAGLLPGTGLVHRGVQELVHWHGLPMGRFCWLPLRGRFSPLMRLSGRNPEKSVRNEPAYKCTGILTFPDFGGDVTLLAGPPCSPWGLLNPKP